MLRFARDAAYFVLFTRKKLKISPDRNQTLSVCTVQLSAKHDDEEESPEHYWQSSLDRDCWQRREVGAKVRWKIARSTSDEARRSLRILVCQVCRRTIQDPLGLSGRHVTGSRLVPRTCQHFVALRNSKQLRRLHGTSSLSGLHRQQRHSVRTSSIMQMAGEHTVITIPPSMYELR